MSKARRTDWLKRWLGPAVAAIALFGAAKWVERKAVLEGWALVWTMSRVRSVEPRSDPRIVIVAIDDATLSDPRLPHWGPGTLDRRAHAEVIRRLHAAGAAAIGVDLFFDRPADNPLTDVELASVMQETGGTVLVLGAAPDADRAGTAHFEPPPEDYQGLRLASPVVRPWLATQTIFGIVLDERERNQRVPAFAHEVYEAYREAHGELEPAAVRQLDNDLMAIRWPRQPAFTVVPYREFWDGSWLRAHPHGIAGKAVLIGETSAGNVGDVHVTPVGTMPGVLVHAAALQTLLDRSAPVGWPIVSFLLAAVAFLLITLAAYRFPPVAVALLTVGTIAAAWANAYLCLNAVPSAWIDPMAATFAALTACGSRIFWQSIASRSALSRFVAPEVAQELAATGRLSRRHEGEREATILFADIREYTALSEDRAPAEMLQLLNEHFAWMDAVVKAHGGRVDKHVGDAMMAVFTGPRDLHAANAVAAAEALIRGSGNQAHTGIRFGIGVHTGILATGTLGRTKAEWAVIGDTVNVASRLEGATKTLGVPVLISAATARRLGAGAGLILLGEVELKGKTAPVEVYTLAPVAAQPVDVTASSLVPGVTPGPALYPAPSLTASPSARSTSTERNANPHRSTG